MKSDIPVAGVAHQAGTVPVRQRPGHVGARQRLQGPRAGQPLRRGHQLLPQHRRGEPGADGDGQRAAGRRPPAAPDGRLGPGDRDDRTVDLRWTRSDDLLRPARAARSSRCCAMSPARSGSTSTTAAHRPLAGRPSPGRPSVCAAAHPQADAVMHTDRAAVRAPHHRARRTRWPRTLRGQLATGGRIPAARGCSSASCQVPRSRPRPACPRRRLAR